MCSRERYVTGLTGDGAFGVERFGETSASGCDRLASYTQGYAINTGVNTSICSREVELQRIRREIQLLVERERQILCEIERDRLRTVDTSCTRRY